MTQQKRPTPTRQAYYDLARWGIGAAETPLIRTIWPDLPQDRERLTGWLETHPDVAEAVTKENPEGPPPGDEREPSPQELSDCPPLPDNARLDPAIANGAGHWIDVYTDYADGISPMSPMAFHVSAALFLTSTAIARRLLLPMAHGDIYPNLFGVWVARTTLFRKSTSLRIADNIAWQVFPHLLSPQDTTPEAFLSDMAGREPSYFNALTDEDREEWQRGRDFAGQRGWILDEMSSLLASAGRDYNAGLTEALLRFYDCHPRFVRSTRGQGRVVIRNAYLSLLGASTPAALSPHLLSQQLWMNGWWPRFAIITPNVEQPQWRVPKERDQPPALLVGLQTLYDRLPTATWPNMPTPLTVTLGAGVHEAWQRYNKALSHDLLLNNVDLDYRLEGTYGRLPEQALKVATILAALDWPPHRNAPEIELPHFARAMVICENWRASTHRAIAMVTISEFDRLRGRILRQIARHLPEGATKRDIRNGMRDVSPGQLEETLLHMITLGDIKEASKDPHKRGPKTARYILCTE